MNSYVGEPEGRRLLAEDAPQRTLIKSDRGWGAHECTLLDIGVGYIPISNYTVGEKFVSICDYNHMPLLISIRRRPVRLLEHQTTNLGVRSSNLFGRASYFN